MDTNDAHVSQTLVEVIAKRGPLKTTAHKRRRLHPCYSARALSRLTAVDATSPSWGSL